MARNALPQVPAPLFEDALGIRSSLPGQLRRTGFAS